MHYYCTQKIHIANQHDDTTQCVATGVIPQTLAGATDTEPQEVLIFIGCDVVL